MLRILGSFSDYERYTRRIFESGKPYITPAPLHFFPAPGKLISIGTASRFDHYLGHTHDYVEMIYTYAGTLTHLINGAKVFQNTGELLLLSQNAKHERLPAREEDIAVILKILPRFFRVPMDMMSAEGSALHGFLCNCRENNGRSGEFLHFKVADNLQVQNLLDNLTLSSLINPKQDEHEVNQFTMGLLFIHLLHHMNQDHLNSEHGELMSKILQYVEEHYAEGSLNDLAKKLYYDPHWLSADIKRLTGNNFTQLMQNKRMTQAKFLLEATDLPVSEISKHVGYNNSSYFYRLFQHQIGCSPGEYRAG